MIDNTMFTVGHFIKGDEVYLIGGDGEPIGMVTSIGSVNVHVRVYESKRIVAMKPTELYLGKEWHSFNQSYTIIKDGITSRRIV